MSASNVVIYRYDTSPFGHKVANMLLLKGIPHQQVDVAPIPPRPELELLGIKYRRIPVLAIGRDVYIDTSLIASALERRFPASEARSSLFPLRKGGSSADTGLIKAFSMSYPDRSIFPLASRMLPWHKLPKAFVEDRSRFSGAKLDPAVIQAVQPQTASALSSHLALIEEQLSDGREWLFDTVTPSLADLSIHFPLAWMMPFPGSKSVLDKTKYPKSLAWLGRMNHFLSERKAAESVTCTKISGQEAAQRITSSSYDERLVFDEAAAARLGLSKNALISVAPDDTGRDILTHGTLVGLNDEEIVIETTGPAGSVRCHFPKLHYTARVSKAGAKL